MFTNSKCEEFAVHFRDKIDTLRSNLCQSQPMNLNITESLFLCEETLEKFVLIDVEMLGKVISQSPKKQFITFLLYLRFT